MKKRITSKRETLRDQLREKIVAECCEHIVTFLVAYRVECNVFTLASAFESFYNIEVIAIATRALELSKRITRRIDKSYDTHFIQLRVKR